MKQFQLNFCTDTFQEIGCQVQLKKTYTFAGTQWDFANLDLFSMLNVVEDVIS